jgi:hypothetical protein
MIAMIRDEEGNITAVCEWFLLDNDGLVSPYGETIFIGELEVNPGHRNGLCLKKFIKLGMELAPNAKKVCWFRETKYPGRKRRLFNIDTLDRRS